MIQIIETPIRHLHTEILDDMFRLRATVFKERLQWDVEVHNGREIDVFDDADPLYLLARDDAIGRLEGAVRLLPTTGPNMLRDVFPQLLTGDEIVESPLVWESSRFCIDPDLVQNANGGLNRVTSELLCALVEVGIRVGLQKIVSVYDARMARIFRAADCPAELIGQPTKIGKVMTYAGLFEISPKMRHRIASKGGITQSTVLDTKRSFLAE